MMASVTVAIVITVGSNTWGKRLLSMQRRKFNIAKMRAGIVPASAINDISFRDTIAGVR